LAAAPEFAACAYLASVFCSVLPLLTQLGIATAAEVEVDTLAARLRDATVASSSVVALQSLVWAVAREMKT
jgi:hypothetical protein